MKQREGKVQIEEALLKRIARFQILTVVTMLIQVF
jgi:hypothetical protein